VLGLPVLDGVASLGIGILLVALAVFLGRETKSLLLGEPAHSNIASSICAIARAERGIRRSNSLFTVHLGPRQIVAAISADFADDLSAGDVQRVVASVEARARASEARGLPAPLCGLAMGENQFVGEPKTSSVRSIVCEDTFVSPAWGWLTVACR
jgi:hypothetical protein